MLFRPCHTPCTPQPPTMSLLCCSVRKAAMTSLMELTLMLARMEPGLLDAGM